jgi:hypothetical protein
VEYRFVWLLRRPMHAVFDTHRNVLVFPALFPAIDAASDMSSRLRAQVSSRTARNQPAHKRIDGRRARVTCDARRNNCSLTIHVRGTNHAYAVRHALNLINELFLLLQESYPEYLIERFGFSTE